MPLPQRVQGQCLCHFSTALDSAALHPSRFQAMWLYVVALVGLYHLLCCSLERQVVSQLWDKYVFITGCDSGFGNLLAKQLDLRGLRVLAACLTEKGAETLKAQTSDRLETVILDVTKSESIAAATQWVKEHTGDRGLWGLVNNAGISVPTAPNSWMTKWDFMKILDVNLLGVIDVTLSLLPQLLKAKGRMVNFSSVAGRVSIFGGGYCISKYGLEAFSDSLRREVSFFGMQVAIIECGLFKTPMIKIEPYIKAFQSLWDQCSPEIKDIYGKNYLAASIKSLHNMDPQSCEDLTLVTNCMEHALISLSPSHPILCWLECQTHFHSPELYAHLPGRCFLEMESHKAFQGPVICR